MPLDLIFMGTPDFAVPSLEALAAAGHRIKAVYTQPPRPAGRGMAEAKSPVQRRAEALGLRVLTPVNFKSEASRADFASIGADAAVVAAYGLLLPREVLEAPRLGCFNIHASKLPRWRGAAPIQRAIMAGDTVTAVNIMQMELGLDTGPVCLAQDVPITTDMTAGALHDALASVGAELIVQAIGDLERGTLRAQPQPDIGVTYARKIEKSETRIDFSRPAVDVKNQIRGLSPAPGAWLQLNLNGKIDRVRVLSAAIVDGEGPAGTLLDDRLTIACGTGAVRLQLVQRAGKQPMTAVDFLRGVRVTGVTPDDAGH